MFGFRADSLSRLARYLDESTRSRGVSNGVGLGVGGRKSGMGRMELPRGPGHGQKGIPRLTNTG